MSRADPLYPVDQSTLVSSPPERVRILSHIEFDSIYDTDG